MSFSVSRDTDAGKAPDHTEWPSLIALATNNPYGCQAPCQLVKASCHRQQQERDRDYPIRRFTAKLALGGNHARPRARGVRVQGIPPFERVGSCRGLWPAAMQWQNRVPDHTGRELFPAGFDRRFAPHAGRFLHWRRKAACRVARGARKICPLHVAPVQNSRAGEVAFATTKKISLASFPSPRPGSRETAA